jgi:5-methylcytosine-specific restriction protein A
MWARDGRKYRWSVAFPIVDSFKIVGAPDAISVLGDAAFQRVLVHASSILRPLTDEERKSLDDLAIEPQPTSNLWIAIEDEAAMAERSEISASTRAAIDGDLAASAMEGLTEAQRVQVRKRAAWLAARFVRDRQKHGDLKCDKCKFDPTERTVDSGVKPRSLIDVHHRQPLAEGRRYTQATAEFFQLLCPTCHRFEHALIRLAARVGKAEAR